MKLASEKSLKLSPGFEPCEWDMFLPISGYELCTRINHILTEEGKSLVSPQMIYNWRKGKIPLKWVPYVESATNRKVTRYDMRPDYFELPDVH